MLFPFHDMFHAPDVRLRHFYIDKHLVSFIVPPDALGAYRFMVYWCLPFAEHCRSAFLVCFGRHFLSLIGRSAARFKLPCQSGIDSMVFLIGFHLPDSDCSGSIFPVHRLYQFCSAFSLGDTGNILRHSLRVFRGIPFGISHRRTAFETVPALCAFDYILRENHSVFFIKALLVD